MKRSKQRRPENDPKMSIAGITWRRSWGPMPRHIYFWAWIGCAFPPGFFIVLGLVGLFSFDPIATTLGILAFPLAWLVSRHLRELQRFQHSFGQSRAAQAAADATFTKEEPAAQRADGRAYFAEFREALAPAYTLANLGGKGRGLAGKLNDFHTAVGSQREEIVMAATVTRRKFRCQLGVYRYRAVYEDGRDADTTSLGLFVLLPLSADYSRVVMRPENLADKVGALIATTDIFFPSHPAFCRRYYIAAEQPDHVRKELPRALLDVLSETDSVVVEINGTHLALLSERRPTGDEALRLVALAARIDEAVNST